MARRHLQQFIRLFSLSLPLPEWYFHCLSVTLPSSRLPLTYATHSRIYTLLPTPTAQIVLTALSVVLMAYSGVQASLTMHDDAFRNLMRAPMSFFDTTPIGRILNRFSRDQVCSAMPLLSQLAVPLDMVVFLVSYHLLNHLTCRM